MRSKAGGIILVVLAVALLLFTGICGEIISGEQSHEQRIVFQNNVTVAEVVEVKHIPNLRTRGSWYPSVEFYVDGKKVVADLKRTKNKDRYHVGDEVEIYYGSWDPTEVLDKPLYDSGSYAEGARNAVMLGYLFSTVIGVFGIVNLVRSRKKLRG